MKRVQEKRKSPRVSLKYLNRCKIYITRVKPFLNRTPMEKRFSAQLISWYGKYNRDLISFWEIKVILYGSDERSLFLTLKYISKKWYRNNRKDKNFFWTDYDIFKFIIFLWLIENMKPYFALRSNFFKYKVVFAQISKVKLFSLVMP